MTMMTLSIKSKMKYIMLYNKRDMVDTMNMTESIGNGINENYGLGINIKNQFINGSLYLKFNILVIIHMI